MRLSLRIHLVDISYPSYVLTTIHISLPVKRRKNIISRTFIHTRTPVLLIVHRKIIPGCLLERPSNRIGYLLVLELFSGALVILRPLVENVLLHEIHILVEEVWV